MSKKLTVAFTLIAGLSMAAPATASACGACAPRPVYRQPVCQPRPVCRPVPVCQPVCQPVCDPCRRSGLFGLGILGIL